MMKSSMFVFIGLSQKRSDEQLQLLCNQVNEKLLRSFPELQVDFKNRLISIRYENVNYYLAIVKEKKELKDWVKMAKDFELSVNLDEVNKELLSKRFASMKSSFPNSYKELHYTFAEQIFEEMFGLPDLKVHIFF